MDEAWECGAGLVGVVDGSGERDGCFEGEGSMALESVRSGYVRRADLYI